MDESGPDVVRRKGRREALWIVLGVVAGLVVLMLLAVALAGFFGFTASSSVSVGASTRESSTMTNLMTVRSQLALYKAQHDEHLPDLFEMQMTRYTDVDGNTSHTRSRRYKFGPYLMRVPENPYTGVPWVTTVADAGTGYTAAADMTFGWWYNSATGEFRCHVPDSLTTAGGTQVNGM